MNTESRGINRHTLTTSNGEVTIAPVIPPRLGYGKYQLFLAHELNQLLTFPQRNASIPAMPSSSVGVILSRVEYSIRAPEREYPRSSKKNASKMMTRNRDKTSTMSRRTGSTCRSGSRRTTYRKSKIRDWKSRCGPTGSFLLTFR